MSIIPPMRARVFVLTVAGVLGVLLLLHLLQRSGARYERLERQTDSLNVQVEAYRADSASRQRAIDSALAASASAESAAVRSRQQAARFKQQRDSAIAMVRADTGDVPREQFEFIVAADSAAIRGLTIANDSLTSANTSLRAAFNASDAARHHADSLLFAMERNRDEWKQEAKRERRVGLVVGGGYALPSGDWQAFIGIGKKIRLGIF